TRGDAATRPAAPEPARANPTVAEPLPTAPTDLRRAAGGTAVGAVVATGGELVALLDGERRLSPSAVPPGHYIALVRFAGEAELVKAGAVSVRAGATSRLRCDAIPARCVEESP
ncbi:MAG: hypothetical protein Q8P41_22145, partial [Pseudomonadota bacterium]|nr:hypothetical protein [Pseudomonadota bacterium]